MSLLDRLGWQIHRRSLEPATRTAPGRDAPIVARVRRVDRGECDVIGAHGDLRVLSDSHRSQADRAPATGDWVHVSLDPDPGPRIVEVLPRRSAIVRRDPAEEVVEQVLVANVDIVGVVVGVDRPMNVAKIERFLVLAADSGAAPLVICTKTDLGVGADWEGLVDALGGDVDVITTSSRSEHGLDALHERIADDRTLVLLGESGAGKSTLVNALVGEEVLATGEVRAGDAKGRHTTTARELVLVPGGGVLIDTPGVRGVGLWDAADALDRVFSDVAQAGEECRFGDCAHRAEPGCAVRAAVAAGTLDGERVGRYLRLRDELDDQADRIEDRRRSRRGRR